MHPLLFPSLLLLLLPLWLHYLHLIHLSNAPWLELFTGHLVLVNHHLSRQAGTYCFKYPFLLQSQARLGYYNSTIYGLQVGDKVQKGQVICIIEAMKLMNEIEVRTRSRSDIFFLRIFILAILCYIRYYFINKNDIILIVHPLLLIIGFNCYHAQFWMYFLLQALLCIQIIDIGL